jgi:hypothetical protein
LRRERQTAGQDRPDRVEAVGELGHHPEVAPAAPQRPKQVRVRVGAGGHGVAVGGDDPRGKQVVAGQPVLAVEPAEAAPQGEAGDAGD